MENCGNLTRADALRGLGSYNGTLKGTPATELGAIVVRETLQRAKLSGDKIGTVVMDDVIQAGARMNPARQASVGGSPMR